MSTLKNVAILRYIKHKHLSFTHHRGDARCMYISHGNNNSFSVIVQYRTFLLCGYFNLSKHF